VKACVVNDDSLAERVSAEWADDLDAETPVVMIIRRMA
jgi:hypothetical protein